MHCTLIIPIPCFTRRAYFVSLVLQRKEEEAVRIMLKHLRRRRYKEAFEALSRESGVQLEGCRQRKLWNALVENGDYELAEKIFDEAVAGNICQLTNLSRTASPINLLL